MGKFVHIKPGEISVEAQDKVVRAEDYAVYADAKEIIAKAEEEAARIREEAAALREEERQRGYEDGQMEAKLEVADQMINVVSQTVNYLQGVEGEVVDIVQGCIEKILGERDKTDLVVDVVKNALNSIRNERMVKLRVNPKQVKPVQERVDEIIAAYPAITQLTVGPDSRLSETGCILECEIGIVDASLDTQLKQLRDSFEKIFGENAPD